MPYDEIPAYLFDKWEPSPEAIIEMQRADQMIAQRKATKITQQRWKERDAYRFNQDPTPKFPSTHFEGTLGIGKLFDEKKEPYQGPSYKL